MAFNVHISQEMKKILAVNIDSALNSLLEFEDLQMQHNQSEPCDN